MMKYLKNDRGDFGVPFIACYILAMVILLTYLLKGFERKLNKGKH